eukprot:5911361-Prymnesium_polylepis.2
MQLWDHHLQGACKIARLTRAAEEGRGLLRCVEQPPPVEPSLQVVQAACVARDANVGVAREHRDEHALRRRVVGCK